jgi:hypothetical protein
VQRAAIHELGDEVLPVVELSRLVDGHDVRMIQCRRGLRFLLKAAPRRLVGDLVGQELDGDGTVEPRVPRAEHLAHTTNTEACLDLVGAKTFAGNDSHLMRNEMIA